MRSLERSRNKDLDQVDPERMHRGGAEFSWDDLKSVPFKGGANNNPREAQRDLKDMLEELDDSLLDDETRKERKIERNKKKIDDIFKGMSGISSFGKNAR